MTNTEFLDLAITTMGGQTELDYIIRQSRVRTIEPHFIRKLYMVQVKEAISIMSPQTLGEICDFGADFKSDNTLITCYRCDTSESSLHLKKSDSGLALLQKVAAASMLSAITKLVIEGQPKSEGNGSVPVELRSKELIKDLEKRGDTIKKQLGW